MTTLNLPVYSFFTTFLIMGLLLTTRYLLGSGFFYLCCPQRSERTFISHDIYWSLMSSGVFAFFSAVLIKSWHAGKTQIYTDFNLYPLWYSVVSLCLYLIVHDLYFYLGHRLFHLKLMKYHRTHHRSLAPSAWTSFSFHPVEAIFHAIFLPVMVLIVPIHWSTLLIYLSLMGLFGITNHLGREIYPGFFEKKLTLITATHHQKHHENPNVNFGLYFTWWDKILNTEHKVDRHE